MEGRRMDSIEEIAARDNGFGPVCKRRDKSKKPIIEAQIVVILVCSMLFIIYRMLMSPGDQMLANADWHFLSGTCFAMIVSEGVRRCCLFSEEYRHVEQRYKGSRCNAIRACLSLPCGKVVIGIVLFGCLAHMVQAWWISKDFVYPFLLYIIMSTIISLISNILQIERMTDVEICEHNENHSKNVSPGAAWIYYFGYLKLILPQFPTTFEKARGEEYKIDGEDIRDCVTDNSLFIIIPRDGYCYKEFSLVDSRISFQHNMPKITQARGGIAERVYQNNLSKIEIEGKETKYAVMEYATPLFSLYDMAEHAKVQFTNEEKEREVVQFYLRLKEIINSDPQCAGRCKLILTGPVATNDIDNEKKLADIMWEKIAYRLLTLHCR